MLNVREGTNAGAALAFRMNVFRHVGYFVDLTRGPVERREWVSDDLFSVSYRTALLGVMGVGVFAEGFLGPYGFAYGAGYGMAGDGRNANELFLHRATVRRRFRSGAFLLAGVRHWYRSGGIHVVGVTGGLGWDL